MDFTQTLVWSMYVQIGNNLCALSKLRKKLSSNFFSILTCRPLEICLHFRFWVISAQELTRVQCGRAGGVPMHYSNAAAAALE